MTERTYDSGSKVVPPVSRQTERLTQSERQPGPKGFVHHADPLSAVWYAYCCSNHQAHGSQMTIAPFALCLSLGPPMGLVRYPGLLFPPLTRHATAHILATRVPRWARRQLWNGIFLPNQ